MEPGLVLADRYEIVGPIAEGAGSAVWEARDRETGDTVAVKAVSLERAGWRAEVRDRFQQEARLLTLVRHRHVVGVRDVGETDDGYLYLVLDRLSGETLASRLSRPPRLGWRDAAAIALELARGLGALHGRGVVHRDLKPANVMLHQPGDGGAPVCKIIDLGISKVGAAAVDPVLFATLTATGQVLGTPEYMSYEQAVGERDVDARTDVWALGVVLYEMIAGVRPFAGANVNAVLAAIRKKPPAPLAAVARGTPEALAGVVLRCLDPSRDRRYPDGEAVRAALVSAVARGDQEEARAAQRRLGAIAGGATLVLACAAVAGLSFGRRSVPPAAVSTGAASASTMALAPAASASAPSPAVSNSAAREDRSRRGARQRRRLLIARRRVPPRSAKIAPRRPVDRLPSPSRRSSMSRHLLRMGVCLGAYVLVAATCSSGNKASSTNGSGTGGTSPSATAGSGQPGNGGGPGSGGAAVDAGPIVAPQPLSPNIVVDQFGYPTGAEKIAVIRSPQKGFDTGPAFTPGPMYALVDAHSSKKLLEAAPVAWNGGAVDASSGDKAWWFDFSSVTTPGDYFVLDETQAVRSDVLTISDAVYRDVLAQALRMLFYQRDGFAKTAQYAGADWVDGAAHMGQCYLYSDAEKTLNKDLHGGWWDAGDFNKYTNWGAEDVIELLRAYQDTPAAFFDDYNIPESGNGVPDVLDEAKWELDWLVRMQGTDGSVLSIVDEPSAPSPSFGNPPDTSPSKVTDPCFYGPATTAASFSTAAAFAYASIVFGSVSKAGTAYPGFAADLATRAQQAYAWATAHNAVYFYNSQNNVGAGEQEVGAAGIPFKQLEAALYLFQLTGTASYRADFDANYTKTNLFHEQLRRRLPQRRERDPPHLHALAQRHRGRGAEDQVRLRHCGPELRQPGIGDSEPRPLPGLSQLVRVGLQPGEGGPGEPLLRSGDLRRRSHQPGRRARRRALRPLHPRREPAPARLPVEHGRSRRHQVGHALLPLLVRQGLPLGRRGRLHVRPASRLPHRRPQPQLHLG